MDEKVRRALEEDGWRFGTVQEFLGLTDEEAALIEIHLKLGDALRERRLQSGLTQVQLARRMGSSQSRVAKMELGSPSVSLDLLIRGLLATGATTQEIGAIIASAQPPQPMNRAADGREESAAAD
ncbi:MAG TPA: helix-turn-helix transcriptional regulator [Longimicrobium sp.]|nr:helix-turn-helix transcriptional regulator [Longimicrobium sp.]